MGIRWTRSPANGGDWWKPARPLSNKRSAAHQSSPTTLAACAWRLCSHRDPTYRGRACVDSPRDPCSDAAARATALQGQMGVRDNVKPDADVDSGHTHIGGTITARETTKTDYSYMEMGGTWPSAAGKRGREQPSDPQRVTKLKRKPAKGGRKRGRSPSQGGAKKTRVYGNAGPRTGRQKT